MVNKDIFGGIKSAISKGYSLQSGMQSFYNAGYKKEEIYEAARKWQKLMYVKEQQKKQQIPEKKTTSFFEKLMPFKKSAPSDLTKIPPVSPPSATSPTGMPQTSKAVGTPSPTGAPPSRPLTLTAATGVSPASGKTPTLKTFAPKQIPITKKEVKPSFKPKSTPSPQNVSSYGEEKIRPKKDKFAIILVIALLVLLGILAAVFFFREEMLVFFESFLG
jgi:hypothetical protein